MIKTIKSILRVFFTFLAKRQLQTKPKGLKVNGLSKFTSKTIIGDFCNFNGIRINGSGKVTIGNYFHSGKNLIILTSTHNYEGTRIPYDDSYVTKDVEIGDNVWIGLNVIILSGIKIGEGAIIQAGSVVVNDVPALSICGGHPAKVFSKRNEEHYYSLKANSKFF
jgi:acetyltransferase-like isoleucine patch superfamily enzyme